MNRDQWNQRYAAAELLWSAEANRFVMSEVAGLSPGTALDIAAGEGRNAVWLADRGWQVVAVDFADVGLEKGRRLAASRGVTIDWINADVLEYEPLSGFFDLVLLCYLHVPVAERRLILQKARSALAPGGLFVYIGHDLSNIEHGYGGPQDPSVLCTPQDIAAELPDLVIEKAEVVLRPVALEPGHGAPVEAIARDTLVRAHRRR